MEPALDNKCSSSEAKEQSKKVDSGLRGLKK